MRRSRPRHDDGPLDDVLPALVGIAKNYPAVGVVLSVCFLAVGTWLFSGPGRHLFFGLGWMFGMLALVVGLIILVAALVGWLKQRFQGARQNAVPSLLNQLIGGVRGTVSARPGVDPSSLTLERIKSMPWDDFERLVADLFRRHGYRVDEVGGQSDGGVDLVLHGGGDPAAEHLVQCKRYQSWSVGEPEIRDFFGVMAARRTRCEGIFVTCGRYTEPAQKFAAGKPIRLIDGDQLIALLQSVNPIAPAVTVYTQPTPPPATPVAPSITAPICPKCKIPLVRRMAGRGPNKGNPFWGCSNYPHCTFIVDIRPQ